MPNAELKEISWRDGMIELRYTEEIINLTDQGTRLKILRFPRRAANEERGPNPPILNI